MNYFFSAVTLATGLTLLTVTAIGLLAAARLRGVVANLLAFVIIAYSVVVLLAEALSLLNRLSWSNLLVAHALAAMLTLPLVVKFGPLFFYSAQKQLPRLKTVVRETVTQNWDVAALGVVTLAAMLLGACLILAVPPNTNDSYLYHLSRVAYWLQQGNLNQFYAPNLVKIIHPFNAEIGLLWLTALWGTDLLAGFLQWFAAGFTMIAIYGIARQLQFSRPAGLFAALGWSAFTIVVAQSTSTKNDIVAAFFVMALLFFLLAGLRSQSRQSWLNLGLAGLAFGLAAGTKNLSFLAMPGLGLMVGWLVLTQPRQYLAKTVFFGAAAGLGLSFLGAYNYALDWFLYGWPFGPPAIGSEHTIGSPSLAALVTNLARIGYQFADPTGLPAPVIEFIQQWRPSIGAAMFALFHLDPNLPHTSWGDATFSFTDGRYFVSRDGLSWYGPLSFLILLPALFYQLAIAPFTQKNIWRWFTAFSAVCFIAAFALLIRWQPYMGRYLMIGVTLGAPLMASFYDGWRRLAPGRWAAVLTAIWVLTWSATHNFHRPAGQLTGLDYYDFRTIERPYMAPVYRYLDGQIPTTARLGIAGDWLLVDWDYLLFGPELKRQVKHLNLATLNAIDARTFADNNIDTLILSAAALKTAKPAVPLWPVTNFRVEWYLANRAEAEIFAAGQQNPAIFAEAYGSDYHAYQAIKTRLNREPSPVKILTTDPRMPYYEQDARFQFRIPQKLTDFAGFTHLVISPHWTPADYDRLGLTVTELQGFLAQGKFVEKIFAADNYTVYKIIHPQPGSAP